MVKRVNRSGSLRRCQASVSRSGCPVDRELKVASKADSLRRCQCIRYAILAFLLAVSWMILFVVSWLVSHLFEVTALPLRLWSSERFDPWFLSELLVFLTCLRLRPLWPCELLCEDDIFVGRHFPWASCFEVCPSSTLAFCRTTQ